MISLASEFTDRKGRHARGWFFFDADCQFCTRLARWLLVPLRRRDVGVAPLQDPRVAALLAIPREELLRAVRFVDADGSQFSGADALLAVAYELWWATPLAWVAKIPRLLPILRTAYGWGAARSHCHAYNNMLRESPHTYAGCQGGHS
jgi:predicted DCC family thiol-disulfide oxidoreductase YuxK